jgi:DMSO/TMAO reductase YedYZ molybdopterin-dependent catalytic subunit
MAKRGASARGTCSSALDFRRFASFDSKKPMNAQLPPGQREILEFPRFGIDKFATRFPQDTARIDIELCGDVERTVLAENALQGLPRIEQVSDFHCVTTWSKLGLRWGGVRFSDFYEQVIVPRAAPKPGATVLLLRAQDGARTSLALEDALAPNVLLADELDGRPLSIEHGAPVRIVAPSQYGYKSAKHLSHIEFRSDLSTFRPSGFRFMDHPRARVAYEERGLYFPGWFLRSLYRPLIGITIRKFAKASAAAQRSP